ncbi:MAG: DUF1573 domain-containing protein [Patescibacteria group bacterium]|nr:DUF1573 domain-containing protein [Patescibacteria group bacterium]
MRVAVIIVVAFVVGIGAGVGTANLRLRSSVWDGDPIGGDSGGSVASRPGQGSGKAQVGEIEHDFGSMDEHAQGRYDFAVTNIGEGSLEVTGGDTSCGCTMSEIEKSELAPGESTNVTVTWKGEGREGPFRHTATVHTSDPEHSRITFTVSGRITQAVRITPRELVFSQLAVGDSAEGEVQVFCHLDKPLEVSGWGFSEAAEASFFDVTVEPMPAEQLASNADASSGVRVKITLKPGLPQGTFRQRILLKTNLDEAPELAIPVRGNLVGDISVVAIGPGWDAEHSLLSLGTVRASEGIRRQLLLVARGDHREGMAFEPIRVFPDWLEVTVGETSQVGGGTVNQTPVSIVIPEGAPPAVHLGSEQGELGEIRLKTNHPRTPELRIRLRFAVEGQ